MDVVVGDWDLVEEEVEEGVEVGVGVARQEEGVHVQDAGHGGAWEAQGGEGARGGFQGGERGGAEGGV